MSTNILLFCYTKCSSIIIVRTNVFRFFPLQNYFVYRYFTLGIKIKNNLCKRLFLSYCRLQSLMLNTQQYVRLTSISITQASVNFNEQILLNNKYISNYWASSSLEEIQVQEQYQFLFSHYEYFIKVCVILRTDTYPIKTS